VGVEGGKIRMINISKYSDFFHDGSIRGIDCFDDQIIIFMESAELDQEDIGDDISLTNNARICGNLHIEKVKFIRINGKYQNTLKKTYDEGGIINFEVKKNFAMLSIDWVNFPPKKKTNEFSVIEIEAEKIWWENTPNFGGS